MSRSTDTEASAASILATRGWLEPIALADPKPPSRPEPIDGKLPEDILYPDILDRLDEAGLEREFALVRRTLREMDQPHLDQFLDAWPE